MTQEDIKYIIDILQDKYNFDDLGAVEFVMEYERKSGQQIPNEWLGVGGRMRTVKRSEKV